MLIKTIKRAHMIYISIWSNINNALPFANMPKIIREQVFLWVWLSVCDCELSILTLVLCICMQFGAGHTLHDIDKYDQSTTHLHTLNSPSLSVSLLLGPASSSILSPSPSCEVLGYGDPLIVTGKSPLVGKRFSFSFTSFSFIFCLSPASVTPF